MKNKKYFCILTLQFKDNTIITIESDIKNKGYTKMELFNVLKKETMIQAKKTEQDIPIVLFYHKESA